LQNYVKCGIIFVELEVSSGKPLIWFVDVSFYNEK